MYYLHPQKFFVVYEPNITTTITGILHHVTQRQS